MKIPRAKLYIDFFILLKSFFKILLGIDLKRGVKVENFEKTASNYWNRKKCLTVSTCRVSLHYVLKSLQLNPDDQVLLTPIQIPDFINVIIGLKLKPIFLEIDKKTKSVDLDDLEKKINNRSKVLLATYLNGMVPNIEKISDICSKNSIHLIEDISHSYGSLCGQKKAGTFGLTAIGSMSPGKVISSIGGGFILIDNQEKIDYIQKQIKADLQKVPRKTLIKICVLQLKISIFTSKFIFNFFTYYLFLFLSVFFKNKFEELHHPKYKYFNKDSTIYDNPPVLRKLPKELFFQFNDLQAEIALKTFNKNINYGLKKRQDLAKCLYENLNDEAKKFIPKAIVEYHTNSFWHFPIILDEKDRSKFQKFLLKKGYDVVGYGMKLCSKEIAFSEYSNNLVYAEILHKNSLFLPMFDGLKSSDMLNISKSINEFFINKEK